MPVYEFVTKDLTGKETTGTERGPHVDAIVDSLHKRGFIVLSISERQQRAALMGKTDLRSRVAGLQVPGISAVSVRTLALFTRQLGTMLEAGLPLVRSLQSLARDERSKFFRTVLLTIASDIQQGRSLSEALEKHPRVFNHLYRSMVRAGERSGHLDHVLNQLGEYLEKVDAIRTKVKSAMTYPSFVLLFTIGASAFLLLKIVPTFAKIYADFNAQLPAPTRFVMAMSTWSQHNVPLIAAIMLLFAVAIVLWGRTPRGAYALDAFLLKVPILGQLALKATMSRFTRTLASLFSAGLPMLEALELVEGACGNRVVGAAVRRSRDKIAQGGELAESFAEEKVIPSMVIQLMVTGQESGELDAMLNKAAHFCDIQVDAGVQALTSMIEPVLIVIMGFIVGGLVVTMFLPVFNLGQAISGSA